MATLSDEACSSPFGGKAPAKRERGDGDAWEPAGRGDASLTTAGSRGKATDTPPRSKKESTRNGIARFYN